jgi:ribosome maturation factor RimP
MATPARLQQLIEPIVTGFDLELFDLHYTGSTLAVLVDRPRSGGGAAPEPGHHGVDLDTITKVTRAVSRALDEADPIRGHYSLEVSSPGLERPLRTPAHFIGAVGELVTVKTRPDWDGPRRLRGELLRASGPEGSADAIEEPSIDVQVEGAVHTVPYDVIDKARTVFEWGPSGPAGKPPRPNKPKQRPRGPVPPAGGTADGTGAAAPPEDEQTDTSRVGTDDDDGGNHASGGSATVDGSDAMINGHDQKVSAT